MKIGLRKKVLDVYNHIIYLYKFLDFVIIEFVRIMLNFITHFIINLIQ